MIRKSRIILISGTTAATVAIGPAMTLVAAELALRLGRSVAVPVWDRGFAWALRQESKAVLILCIVGLLTIWPPLARLRRVVTLSLIAVLLVAIGTLSLLFAVVPTLNTFYDRYQPVIANATRWAPQFSDARFASIRNGMVSDEVIRIAGQPLDRVVRNGKEFWVYSQIGHYNGLHEKGFHQRTVIFENGHVVSVQRRYLTAEHAPF